ncbi:MAG TPA: spore cortex-lytic enzyme [Candidatus Aphodomorpha intestinavium]|uniref:Spore cortex-lytic enzyme n=1 Tax=Candidatus Aphodomorpha intestinavium TaxID=2840672 RepID=A0A9D1STK2_9FIRM|nr:spore cortex-lytic enzyme [Candidatus Aphodomorpha intestinavium]
MSRPLRHFMTLVLAATVLLCALAPATRADSLRRGSEGDQVITLQKKLKNWGYYTGSVDGIFGSETEEAVRYFQRKNGLAVDGVVGPDTARALGMTLTGGSAQASGGSSGTNSSSGDLYLLARCVYGEARGEPYKGQVAVAAVILNRTKNSGFPSSIAGVIYQPGAFSVVADGQINLTPDETALRAARDAMNGWDPTGGCLYYYNPDKTSNEWMLARPVALRIGDHVFCR